MNVDMNNLPNGNRIVRFHLREPLLYTIVSFYLHGIFQYPLKGNKNKNGTILVQKVLEYLLHKTENILK